MVLISHLEPIRPIALTVSSWLSWKQQIFPKFKELDKMEIMTRRLQKGKWS